MQSYMLLNNHYNNHYNHVNIIRDIHEWLMGTYNLWQGIININSYNSIMGTYTL